MLVFFFFLLLLLFCVGFCLVVQILISQMNTNIYSVNVCASVTSDAFQTIKVFVGAAGCNAQDAPMCGRRVCLSLAFRSDFYAPSFYLL